jgi:hypothetical protein
MSAKKAEQKPPAAEAAAPEAAPAAEAKPAAAAASGPRPEDAVSNKLIDELNRVHVRIPRY